MRKITKLLALTVATAVVLVSAMQVSAVVPLPSSWWTFDNDDGQVPGGFDGAIQDHGANNIDLGVNQWNAAGGQPNTFFGNTVFGDPAPHAPENYVASGATFAGADTGYHLEGGIHRNYSGGNPQTTVPTSTLNDVFSWRDLVQPEGPESGGLEAFAGGSITYNFWMKVNGAGSADDSSRFGTGSSFLIGRRSDTDGGHGGTVQVQLTANPNEFNLQLRNDPGIVQTSTIVANRGDWHHYVVQYDLAGGGSVTVWQDGGVLAGGLKEVLNVSDADITGTFRLNNVAYPGASTKETGDFEIDDLGVWLDTLLSDADVKDLYDLGITAAVPEPSSFILAALGLMGLSLLGWRRKRKGSA